MVTALKKRHLRLGKKPKTQTPAIWIFTEGELTEPAYFNEWKALFLQNNPKGAEQIKIQTPANGTDPKTIYENAKNRLEESAKEGLDDYVFIVIDEDNRFEETTSKEALNIVLNSCKPFGSITKEKVNCIFSNRSFEVWGLLHFISAAAPMDKKSLKKELRKHLPAYEKPYKTFDFSLMKDKISDAIKNAEKLRNENRKISANEYTFNPSTNVDELIKFLQNYFKVKP